MNGTKNLLFSNRFAFLSMVGVSYPFNAKLLNCNSMKFRFIQLKVCSKGLIDDAGKTKAEMICLHIMFSSLSWCPTFPGST